MNPLASNLTTVQPTLISHEQPSTLGSPIMQKQHTHPKMTVREHSPDGPRHRTESHHQMSQSSPQRQLSPKVGFVHFLLGKAGEVRTF